ncbi:MAG TPA: hypothetical protein VF660_05340 [Actinomycetota bacterium]|jgi:hypothetical protein
MRQDGTKDRRLSGRQITTIAVAFAVAVILFPIGAKASGQLVTLMDSSSSRKARIDTKSRLTTVDMPVNAVPWHVETVPGGPIFIPPAGKTTVAIGSLTIANPTSAPERWGATLYSDTSCSLVTSHVIKTYVPAADTVHLDFPEPLVLSPGGSSWCFGPDDDTSLGVTAVGYYY